MTRILVLGLTLVLASAAAAQSPPFSLDPDGPLILPPEGFSIPLPEPAPGDDDPFATVPGTDEGMQGTDEGENDAADAEPEFVPLPPKSDLAGLAAERPGTAAERREQRLDRLFEQLAKADTKERADSIARHIQRRMTQSGSDTVDLLMERAAVAMEAQNLGLALDLLDGVVRMKPDFAEGWNRRATVNFLAGNLGQSVADIEQVLRNEPRHWGALVGLSMILVAMDRKADAVAMMDKALAVHPFIEELKERRERLEREIELPL